ncbi:patatin-like phospholipase family protein [Neorickettsia helminthoeca str. Oregon]|uniref:Patatin-like phospholipase family protein n=1 Tax=Neorickettsia helminthoeca str. Oregon TaxID=1286528 RepID=X5H4W6_9RICK|nr:patatin-like phospholipase family protein [Neorickettsia helminthoeca]AHX11748.1 patatin-like phospholipase family protein [Neorickettsia helminthoeca str. Oregon]
MVYKNLVFKGGGAKIFYSVGALEEIAERGILNDVERTAGVSAGAVLALLVAMDMDINEIKEFFLNFSLTEELDRFDDIAETERFFNHYGRYTGENLLSQLKALLEAKYGNPDITFQEMHDLGCKDVYIFVTDVISQQLVQFSWLDTPNYSVASVVRASSSYPFYFVPVDGPNGELFVDGGLLDNYPLWIFDKPEFLPRPDLKYNPETLGIYLGKCGESSTMWSHNDIKFMLKLFDGMNPGVISEKVNDLDYSQLFYKPDAQLDFLGYMIQVINAGKEAPPKYHHPNFEGEISISTDFVNSTGRQQSTFDLDVDWNVRMELMGHGRNEAKKFFEAECSTGKVEYCYQLDYTMFDQDNAVSYQTDGLITVAA